MSSTVRRGVVTGIARRLAIAIDVRFLDLCSAIPGLLCLPPLPGTETSTRAGALGRRRQSATALQWLSTAESPQASTAAIHLPSSLSPAWPTA
jgi:hypothetical protein